jgi:hypothetical protein
MIGKSILILKPVALYLFGCLLIQPRGAEVSISLRHSLRPPCFKVRVSVDLQVEFRQIPYNIALDVQTMGGGTVCSAM